MTDPRIKASASRIMADLLSTAGGMELTQAQDWADTLVGMAATGRDNTSVQEGSQDGDDRTGNAETW